MIWIPGIIVLVGLLSSVTLLWSAIWKLRRRADLQEENLRHLGSRADVLFSKLHDLRALAVKTSVMVEEHEALRWKGFPGRKHAKARREGKKATGR